MAIGIFHTLNRGVDKRDIFLDDGDRLRFVHNLFEFNNQESSNNVLYFFNRNALETEKKEIEIERKPRKLLVDIFAFCLMPHHYHLLLQPRVENGVSKFMKKLNMGYAKYFNEKYERNGALFEGRYKRILVKNEAHFIHIPYYIHANPLDYYEPGWRQKKIDNHKKALKFLEDYKWSSHADYLEGKNFPSVTSREFLLEFFGGVEGYKKSFTEWLGDFDMENLAGHSLE